MLDGTGDLHPPRQAALHGGPILPEIELRKGELQPVEEVSGKFLAVLSGVRDEDFRFPLHWPLALAYLPGQCDQDLQQRQVAIQANIIALSQVRSRRCSPNTPRASI